MAAKGVPTNKAAFVRSFPDLSRDDVVDKARAEGLTLTAAYVSQVRHLEKAAGRTSSKTGKAKKTRAAKSTVGRPSASAAYPRHTMEKCIRLPRAILDQNAGRACSREQLAGYLGVGLSGELATEISSAGKYGFLEAEGTLQKPTELVRRIIRPQSDTDEVTGYQDALLKAPQFGDVYKHFRGERLPERQFFENSLVDTFSVPREKVSEFIDIFIANAKTARVLEEEHGKQRLVDVGAAAAATPSSLTKAARAANVTSGDTCFVMMPFADPLGKHYELIYKPAIEKAKLSAVRADSDIFGTGKIIDQILVGISGAKVLVAELTGRNPNVFYELGVAHALKKPVVLVSADEQDVPFDVKHIRVITYDKHDPFWGDKLITKVAENIVSALQNPTEAILLLPGMS
jgi:hypothetical protein